MLLLTLSAILLLICDGFSSEPLRQQSPAPISLLPPILPQEVVAVPTATATAVVATTEDKAINNKHSLATWLGHSNAILQSKIGSDMNGLRGLVLDALHKPRQQQQQQHTICQIPCSCIIVANNDSTQQQQSPNKQQLQHTDNRHQSSIDALASTLLTEIQRGPTSQYFPYISSMPAHDDISLSSIGASWTPEQMTKYIRHAPTIRYFENLGSHRENFIQESISNDMSLIGDAPRATSHRILAGWAYDLVLSRCLQGPFGQSGKVRLAVLATMLSFAVASIAPLSLFVMSSSSSDTGSMNELTLLELVETFIPVVISSSYLLRTLLRLQKEPELAMLPWIDIANHKSQSRLNLKYGMFGDEIILKKDDDGEVTTAPLLFINFDYGGSEGIGNDKLLGRYGFVEVDNPNDSLDLEIEDGNKKQIITIGRNGVLRTQLEETPGGCTIKEVVHAISDLRLHLLTDGEEDTLEHIESQRCGLASQWRAEKTRLIDEFLEKIIL